MSEDADPKLIAKALRFLATGFEMAAESGIQAHLERIDGGAPSHFSFGLPKDVRITCNEDMLDFDRFRARLPADFLVRAIGEGAVRETVLDPDGAAIGILNGLAARDGSESYHISRLELTFDDRPGGFAMTAALQLGEPIARTFICTSPVDRRSETYKASFDVQFEDLFKFVFPVTKAQAEALIDRVSERFGVEIERPPFYVSDKHD
jgi:hypothetical protein